MRDRLTQMQQRFVDAYCANGGSGTRAALEAGCTEKSAPVQAAKWLKLPKVIRAIHTAQDEAVAAKITTMKQVRAFWSNTIRDDSQKMADRLKASELFAKAEGAFLHIRPDPDSQWTYAAAENDGSDVIIYLPAVGKVEDAEMPDEEEEI